MLLVQCGGTIDKDYPSGNHGYAFDITDSAAARILTAIAPAGGFELAEVCKKDSLEMTDEDRASLLKLCQSTTHSKILITHGTSTMVQTARMLAPACPDKTIVITGALRPDHFKDSDASFNVGCAVGVLQATAGPAVFVSMSGAVYKYDEVARDSNGRFVPIDHPEAEAGDDPGIILPEH